MKRQTLIDYLKFQFQECLIESLSALRSTNPYFTKYREQEEEDNSYQ